jgi:hypothetical protein
MSPAMQRLGQRRREDRLAHGVTLRPRGDRYQNYDAIPGLIR